MGLRRILSILCLLPLLACGGGGSGVSTAHGTLTLKLGSDSLPNFTNAALSLEKVEIKKGTAEWQAFATVQATYDLLALQNGNGAALATAVQMETGTYTAFRLTWATTNYGDKASVPAFVTPAPGTARWPLTMPITTTVTGSILVEKDALTTAEIMLNGSQLAHDYYASSDKPAYTFQATASLLDLAACARISGLALPGAEVYAETLDGNLVATIQRRALADASGAFVLDALPIGSNVIYYLAAQSSGYAAVSTDPVTATLAEDYPATLAFGAIQTPGSLSVALTPASSSTQGTWVELRQNLQTGSSGSQPLIVRAQTMDTNSTASRDQVTLAGLAPGTYGVKAQRSSAGAVPVATTAQNPSIVTASNIASVTLP